jgi:hypothetical protein
MAIWFFTKKLSDAGLVGIWKHPIGTGNLNVNGKVLKHLYTYEIFKFKADKTFTFGEYGITPLYEVRGTWRLSNDKTRIELFYDDGESNSIDIRDYDGKTFITTSREGNNFKFTKE